MNEKLYLFVFHFFAGIEIEGKESTLDGRECDFVHGNIGTVDDLH